MNLDDFIEKLKLIESENPNAGVMVLGSNGIISEIIDVKHEWEDEYDGVRGSTVWIRVDEF
jgi:hypothetical protein